MKSVSLSYTKEHEKCFQKGSERNIVGYIFYVPCRYSLDTCKIFSWYFFYIHIKNNQKIYTSEVLKQVSEAVFLWETQVSPSSGNWWPYLNPSGDPGTYQAVGYYPTCTFSGSLGRMTMYSDCISFGGVVRVGRTQPQTNIRFSTSHRIPAVMACTIVTNSSPPRRSSVGSSCGATAN